MTAFAAAFDRARAERQNRVRHFSDPLAYALLPPALAACVDGRATPSPWQALLMRATDLLTPGGDLVAPLRTVAIDEAIRQAPRPQLVNLGSGLDARAWRLAALRHTTVFEVEQPGMQRYKRVRLGAQPLVADDVRFVAIDFERQALGERLDAAGHDPARPTFWLCEAVIPYLRRPAIRALLGAVAARSAPGSRLALLYTEPTVELWLSGLFLRRRNEPMRSHFRAPEMAAELTGAGLRVVEDSCVLDWARRWARPPWRLSDGHRRMLRLALADRG